MKCIYYHFYTIGGCPFLLVSTLRIQNLNNTPNQYFLHLYSFPVLFAIILEPTMVRTAAFKAEYDVKCDSLNNNSAKTFLQTVLVTRKLKLQKICGKGKCVKKNWFSPLSFF